MVHLELPEKLVAQEHPVILEAQVRAEFQVHPVHQVRRVHRDLAERPEQREVQEPVDCLEAADFLVVPERPDWRDRLEPAVNPAAPELVARPVRLEAVE